MNAIVSIAVLTLAGLPSATGPQQANVQETAVIREAHELLLAAYPELQTQRVEWRTEVTEDGMRVRVLPEPPAFRSPDKTEPDALLSATVSLDERGRLRKLDASGPLVRTARPASAAAAVGGSAEAAATSPAEYFSAGAGSDRVAALVPAGLRRLLGEPDAAASPAPTLDPDTRTLTLRVDLFKVGDDGVSRATTVLIEPSTGRLIGVVKP